MQCQSDDDCLDTQRCLVNNLGQAKCEKVCDESSSCGRNAECSATNHQAVCVCKKDYFGDAKVGCQKVECNTDEQCSHDKYCDNHMCRIACLVKNPCGRNSLCSAENHRQICHCQPGFTGNPLTGCKLLDFCAEKPCGPGAVCQNSRGSYKCTCARDTVGDAYKEGCRAPVECQKHADCPNAAECTLDNGEPKCRGKLPNLSCNKVPSKFE